MKQLSSQKQTLLLSLHKSNKTKTQKLQEKTKKWDT